MRLFQRLSRATALGLILTAATMPAMAQQRNNNGQSAAPPSAGYGKGTNPGGSGKPANGGATGNPNSNTQRPVGFNDAGQSQRPNSPNNAVLNPNLNNPSVNPSDAARAQADANAVVTAQPFPDLTKEEQAFLDQLLGYWQTSTSKVERYGSEFRRWTYDSGNPTATALASKMGKSAKDIPLTIGDGVLRYMAPDKGLFKIEQLVKATGEIGSNKQAEYKSFDNQFGEWWICDGKMIHDLDRGRKVCDRYPIPNDLQGQSIMNSPMPFLFGVEVDKVKARYWIRAIAPPLGPNGKPDDNYFVIEAYPKLAEDASNYHHVTVILDREKFLPIQMIRFSTEHSDSPQAPRDVRDVYEFRNRETNATLLQKINETLFRKEFIPSAVDKSWTVNEHPFNQVGSGPMEPLRTAEPGAIQQPPLQPKR